MRDLMGAHIVQQRALIAAHAGVRAGDDLSIEGRLELLPRVSAIEHAEVAAAEIDSTGLRERFAEPETGDVNAECNRIGGRSSDQCKKLFCDAEIL
jgi:hypothetical protein